MAQSNAAAILAAVGNEAKVGPVERYKPERHQVLIEVAAIAVNPADKFMQETGILIEKYPTTFGCDAAGTVVEIGEGVTHVKVGSRVLAQMTSLEGQSRGAFQKYAIAPEIVVCPMPDSMTFAEASVIPLCFETALSGLYHKNRLNLPLPSTTPQKTGKTLLVWGGASSVGCMTTQLAIASGLDVITTASPHNFDFCKSLGATEVFDYKSDTVVEDIKAAFKSRDCAGVFEASGSQDAMKKCAEILSAIGGGFMGTAQPPLKDLPANVKAEFVNAATYKVDEPDNCRAAWHDFLPDALKSGQFKPAPRPEVVGKGLEAVQGALDTWKRGVSAKKIVVEF